MRMPSSLRSERCWWEIWRLFSLNWMRVFKEGNIEWCCVLQMMPPSWAIWVLFNPHSSPECVILLPKRLFSPLPPVVVQIRHPDKASFTTTPCYALLTAPLPTYGLKYYVVLPELNPWYRSCWGSGWGPNTEWNLWRDVVWLIQLRLSKGFIYEPGTALETPLSPVL